MTYTRKLHQAIYENGTQMFSVLSVIAERGDSDAKSKSAARNIVNLILTEAGQHELYEG